MSASIDHEVCAGDIAAVLGGEEQRPARLLHRLAESAHGQMHHPTLPLLRRVEEIHQQGCPNHPERQSPVINSRSGGDTHAFGVVH
jgi:hypothetical protein